MIRLLLALTLLPSTVLALTKPTEEELRFLHKFEWGLIAQCKDSVMMELQLDSMPLRIDGKGLEKLVSIIGRESSYTKSMPACRPSFDFKVVLVDANGSHIGELKVCTSCGVIGISLNGAVVIRAAFTAGARAELGILFDGWFPGWRERSTRNRELHREELSDPTRFARVSS